MAARRHRLSPSGSFLEREAPLEDWYRQAFGPTEEIGLDGADIFFPLQPPIEVADFVAVPFALWSEITIDFVGQSGEADGTLVYMMTVARGIVTGTFTNAKVVPLRFGSTGIYTPAHSGGGESQVMCPPVEGPVTHLVLRLFINSTDPTMDVRLTPGGSSGSALRLR